jgi:CRP-like cAMP-binding protein
MKGDIVMQSQATLEELVAEHPFVSGLDTEFRRFLCDCASLRRFSSHQHIFQEGGDADHLYLILSGKVTLETLTDCGTLIVETLGPGDALGCSWLLPPHQWRFTATTTTPTELLSFGAEFLRQKASEDPYFATALLIRVAETLVHRVQATREELIHLHRVIKEHNLAA